MNTENVPTLKIHKLTREQYERELGAGRIDPMAIYLTPNETVCSIEQGGTGANNAADALANLGAAPAGYGLGVQFPQSATSLADLDTLTQNGWYVVSASASTLAGVYFNHAMVFVQCRYGSTYQELVPIKSTTKLRRYRYNETWSEWEVENPPMELGVEYRTTERHNGAPVYAVRLTVGELLNKGITTTSLPSVPAEIVEIYGTAKSDAYTETVTFPIITTSGAIGARLAKEGTKNIVAKTFADYSGYIATATVKYTKN